MTGRHFKPYGVIPPPPPVLPEETLKKPKKYKNNKSKNRKGIVYEIESSSSSEISYSPSTTGTNTITLRESTEMEDEEFFSSSPDSVVTEDSSVAPTFSAMKNKKKDRPLKRFASYSKTSEISNDDYRRPGKRPRGSTRNLNISKRSLTNYTHSGDELYSEFSDDSAPTPMSFRPYADEDEYEEINRGWRERADARGTAYPGSQRYIHRNSISRSRDTKFKRSNSVSEKYPIPAANCLRNSSRYHSEMDEDNESNNCDADDENSEEKLDMNSRADIKTNGVKEKTTPVEKPPNIFISDMEINSEYKNENSTTVITTTKKLKLKKKSKSKKQKIISTVITTTIKNKNLIKKKILIKKKSSPSNYNKKLPKLTKVQPRKIKKYRPKNALFEPSKSIATKTIAKKKKTQKKNKQKPAVHKLASSYIKRKKNSGININNNRRSNTGIRTNMNTNIKKNKKQKSKKKKKPKRRQPTPPKKQKVKQQQIEQRQQIERRQTQYNQHPPLQMLQRRQTHQHSQQQHPQQFESRNSLPPQQYRSLIPSQNQHQYRHTIPNVLTAGNSVPLEFAPPPPPSISPNLKKYPLARFKSISLDGIIGNINDNFDIAKVVAKYFDTECVDTDTVAIVCNKGDEPDIASWCKGSYHRKEKNFYGKFILVYRASKHVPCKISVGSDIFASCVKGLALDNDSAKSIADKLDMIFGDGCHVVTNDNPRYEVFCRFSDKYMCEVKVPVNIRAVESEWRYLVAWRR